MNKKIITIAAIVFALIFVIIMAVMMNTITNKANSANNKLVDTLEITDGTDLNSFKDGEDVKGESVIEAIKNVKTLGGSAKLKITVKTKANTTGTEYGYVSATSDAITSYSVTDASDPDYINSSALFTYSEEANDNGIVTAITFTQK